MRVRAVVGLAVVAATLAVLGTLPAGASTGIDVSNYQHPNGAAIDWPAVRASGQRFVFIKATEGANGTTPAYTNPWFGQDWAGAGAAGLLRGAYHYARPASPALLQARDFVAVTGSMQGGADLPPVLDLEDSGGLSPADLVTWTATWLFEVERLTGRRPMIYTGLNFWNTAMGGSTQFAAYRLWFARYVPGNTPGTLPNGFLTWTFWQQSSTGSVPGVPATVDLDNYCCPDGNLNALAGPSAANSNAGSPFGIVDVIAGGPDGQIGVSGWSIDPDVPGPIESHVYIDGVGTNLGPTDVARPDIAAAFGQFGGQHGFAWTGAHYAPGVHQVCIFAINQGYGANTLLSCRNVTVPGGSPIGHVDAAVGSPDGTLTMYGWALDPDSAGSIETHVYVDGKGYNLGPSYQPRPDLAAALPGYGPAHGFSTTIGGLSGGPHQVCTFGINVGVGANSLFECRTVMIPTGSPIGVVDNVVPGPDGHVYVSGWSLDPDTAAPVEIHVYVDGNGYNLGPANQSRPDIAAAFPGYGPAHGFSTTLSGLSPGLHEVCTFGMDIGPGSNTLIRCQGIAVPGGSPIGVLDTAARAADGHLVGSGWTIDPDSAGSIEAHVYVDGVGYDLGPAYLVRPDLAAAFPGYGPAHGFAFDLAVPPGSHQVCAFGINVGVGANRLLACRTVVT